MPIWPRWRSTWPSVGAAETALNGRGGPENLKAALLVESPVAFRRRMLFVGRDVLDRPRRFSAAGRQ